MGRRSSLKIPDSIKTLHAITSTRHRVTERVPFESNATSLSTPDFLQKEEFNYELPTANLPIPVDLLDGFEEFELELLNIDWEKIPNPVGIQIETPLVLEIASGIEPVNLIDLDNPFDNNTEGNFAGGERPVLEEQFMPFPPMAPLVLNSNDVPNGWVTPTPAPAPAPRRPRPFHKNIPEHIIVNGIAIEKRWWAKAYLEKTMKKAAIALFNKMFTEEEVSNATKSGRANKEKLDQDKQRAIEKAVYWMSKKDGKNPYSFDSDCAEIPPDNEMLEIRSKVFVERRNERSRRAANKRRASQMSQGDENSDSADENTTQAKRANN